MFDCHHCRRIPIGIFLYLMRLYLYNTQGTIGISTQKYPRYFLNFCEFGICSIGYRDSQTIAIGKLGYSRGVTSICFCTQDTPPKPSSAMIKALPTPTATSSGVNHESSISDSIAYKALFTRELEEKPPSVA